MEDNGIGIEPKLLPHLFELFTQAERLPGRSQGGLGLGLALVKSLVELHGGEVAAESAGVGSGGKFRISLPCLTDCSEVKQKEEELRGEQDGVLTILVVDDSIDAANTLSMLLQLQGHNTVVEHDAADALRRLAVWIPQVIILDIGLPDMDGYQLAQIIRAMPAAGGATLVALTGYGQSDDIERSKVAGFDHHLVKPVDSARLSSMLDVTQVISA